MKVVTVILLSALSFYGYAQQTKPEKEYVVLISQDKVEMSAGDTRELELKVMRSKGYAKAIVTLGLSSSLPKGIEVTFSPDKGNFEVAKVMIKASDDATPGQHTIILKATLNNKTKGSLIKLNIADKSLTSDNN